ncbi:MAG TPA: DUF72 domain-containing protein [Burkholderiales bacterium]
MGRGELRVGTSGYQYDHWRRAFYPPELPKAGWFAFYARRFDTVEINNTFYRLPEAHVFEAWRAAAPANFRYALKFSRYGTHLKRLRDPAQPIALFLERARRLGPMLGPILVQLPPHWRADPVRLEGFLEALPRAQRWAVEFRDSSWLREPIFALLAKYGVALCVHDMLPRHPRRVTADFVYLRFHGRRYGGAYTPQQLAAHARRVRACLADGIDVYAYFNNDADGHAVRNALDLRRYIGGAAQRAVA